MGFLKSLLGLGLAAGATVAAVKVAEKYKENNPEGLKDSNGDGKVDQTEVIGEVTKAVGEIYESASAKAKEAINDPQGTYEKAKAGVMGAVDKAPGTFEKIKNGAKDVIDSFSDKADGFADKVEDKAEDIADKVEDKAEDIADKVEDKIDDLTDKD